MNIFDAIQERHSVRSYMKKEIPDDIAIQLKKEIQACNIEGKLHIQLITNEPKAFDGFMARYGKFSGVQNYIALIGKQSSGLEEKLGLLWRTHCVVCTNAWTEHLLGSNEFS